MKFYQYSNFTILKMKWYSKCSLSFSNLKKLHKRQIHEGKYEVLCYHKKKEFKCFTFINKFLFLEGKG